MSCTIELSEEAGRTLAAAASSRGVTVEEYLRRFVEAWAANLDTSGGLDAEQVWFWAPEWQAGERKADADAATGRSTVYESDEAFLRALEERVNDPTVTADADS